MPLGLGRAHHLGRGPGERQSPGPAPLGDDRVQPVARNLARHGRRRDRADSSATSNLPITVTTGYQGNAQIFQQALQGQGLLLTAAVLVIYLVLGILYESFIHPITILSGLPAAALGALATLLLFHKDMSVIAIIGIVMLIGIVKKNAIMMIDFALERQRRGMPAEEAIFEACLLRFRPIMMTTMAAIMGGLPIAVAWGAGSELRQPLGLVVVGGLVVSQSLTLFITPVIYLYMEHARTAVGRLLRSPREEAVEGTRVAHEAGE